MTYWLNEFRYALSVIIIFLMPIVISFWIVIHSGSSFWKTKPPALAYGAAGLLIVLVSVINITYLDFLVGTDLGLNLVLLLIGSVVYLISWILWRPVKRHLDFKTFAGVPEITGQKIGLIRDGPFAIIRHPRYLMVAIGILGWCLMANYSGTYLVGIASIIGLILIVDLEERDLIKRFGGEYREYQNEVPKLVPSLKGIKRFLAENF